MVQYRFFPALSWYVNHFILGRSACTSRPLLLTAGASVAATCAILGTVAFVQYLKSRRMAMAWWQHQYWMVSRLILS